MLVGNFGLVCVEAIHRISFAIMYGKVLTRNSCFMASVKSKFTAKSKLKLNNFLVDNSCFD